MMQIHDSLQRSMDVLKILLSNTFTQTDIHQTASVDHRQRQ